MHERCARMAATTSAQNIQIGQFIWRNLTDGMQIHTSCRHLAKNIPRNAKGGSSAKWLQRQLADPFIEMAKKQNYRCRSAFKLLEISEKADIIQPGYVVVDCGAAPGSWTQVAIQKSNSNGAIKNQPKGFVISVDLKNIYPIDGAHILGNTDFTQPESQANIKKLLEDRQIDCVISDMAPNATGVRCLDQENITKLCYSVLRFAILMSSPGASCLVKLWDNGDVAKLEENVLKFYKSVKRIKPPASRSDSSEVFLLARDFAGQQTPPKT